MHDTINRLSRWHGGWRGHGSTRGAPYPPAAIERRNWVREQSPGYHSGLPPGPVPDKEVLVVEDEEQIRFLLRLYLEKQGYTVWEAQSPSEALETWKSRASAISLVITDIVMGGPLSAWELVGELINAESAPTVIITSAFQTPEIFETQIRCRRLHFLPKPYTFPELERLLQAPRAG